MSKSSLPENYYTLINVFTVGSREDQQRIFDEIVSATAVIRRFPGFVSANVHRSHDGARVVNYARWHSKAEFDAMRAHLDVQEHFKACRAITNDIEPIFCELSYVQEG
jgi:heme-degrading monooxygenase HmoA